MKTRPHRVLPIAAAALALFAGMCVAPRPAAAGDACAALGLGNSPGAIHAALTTALKSVAPDKAGNGGLGNQMWETVVDQDGKVCAVTFTGADRISQWPGSRVISAQKANTAASFNLPAGVGGTVDALSTANLWTQVQPGGSLYGLQFSNPVASGNVKGLSPAPRQHNIIYDVNPADKAHAADNSASGFGHPLCGFNEQNALLPATQ